MGAGARGEAETASITSDSSMVNRVTVPLTNGTVLCDVRKTLPTVLSYLVQWKLAEACIQ